jgi:hypothetical protein
MTRTIAAEPSSFAAGSASVPGTGNNWEQITKNRTFYRYRRTSIRLARCVRVNVRGRRDIRMTQEFLSQFEIARLLI